MLIVQVIVVQGITKLNNNDPFRIGNTEDINHLIWDDVDKKTVLKTPIFNMVEVTRRSKEGVQAPFFTLHSPNWVTIIPWYINKEGIPCFVMVQQFRHGSAQVVREFPAGMVDFKEDPEIAAKRELKEETGIECSQLTQLACTNPNPAFMSNKAYFYLAQQLNGEKIQNLDKTEQLDVMSVPVKDVINQMGNSPLYDNGVMLIALGLFLKQTHLDTTLSI